jgi:hypothetical protein
MPFNYFGSENPKALSEKCWEQTVIDSGGRILSDLLKNKRRFNNISECKPVIHLV